MSDTLSSQLNDLDLICTTDNASGLSARDLVASIENVMKNALDDEIAGAVSLLFERGRGLPDLLLRSLEGARRDAADRRELRTELLRLLDQIILEKSARGRQAHVAEYVVPIAKSCLRVFFVETSSKVREESIKTLLAALELKDHVPHLEELRQLLFPPRDQADSQRNPSAVQLFWRHFSSTAKTATGTSETVRGGCLRLLGRLAVLFPVQVSDDPIYETGSLYRGCEAALTRQGVGAPEMVGALEGFDGLLSDASGFSATQVRDVFGFALARLSLETSSGDDLKRFGMPKAALILLGGNLSQFAALPGTPLGASATGDTDGARLRLSLLLHHGQALWSNLTPLWQHRNAELSGLTDEVLRAICALASQQIAEGASCVTPADADVRERAMGAYSFFYAKIRELISNAAVDAAKRSTEATAKMATAVHLLGSFARPVAQLGGVDDVAQHLDALCEYAASYLQPTQVRYYEGGRRGADSVVRHIPPFLHAFAEMLAVLPTAPERALSTLSSLMLIIFSRIDALPGATTSVVAAAALAIQAVLTALQPKGDALSTLLRRLVPAAALVTIDHAASAQAEADASGMPHANQFFGGLHARKLWMLSTDATLSPTTRQHRHATDGRHPSAADVLALGAISSGSEGGVAAPSRRELACSALLGELLAAVSSMLRRLDLAAVSPPEVADAGAEGAAAPAAALAADAQAAGGGEASGDEQAVDGADPTSGGAEAVASNPSDVHLFLAITAFCDGLLREVAPPLLLRWGHVLLLELVGLSGRYPHVSGFYKLIRVVTLVADGAGYFDELDLQSELEASTAVQADADAMPVDTDLSSTALGATTGIERARCFAILSMFLLSLLQRSRRFQDELLASALEMLLVAPLPFVRGKLEQIVGVIELSLGMGHTYQPLAAAALTCLERLHARMPTALRPLLNALLPCLHGYLTVTSEASEQRGTLRKERDARRHTSKAGRQAVINSARNRLRRSAEEVLQLRIIRLLGSVGGDAVALVHGKRSAPPAEGRWEVAPRVGFDLPLPQEMDMLVHLDAVLPRVVELATSSMVYREKAAACELLEACIKLCIGKNAERARTLSQREWYPSQLPLC